MTHESASILRGGPSDWKTGHNQKARAQASYLLSYFEYLNIWITGGEGGSLPVNNFVWSCFIGICVHEGVQHTVSGICYLLPFPNPHLRHFQDTERLYVKQLPLLSRWSKSASRLAMVSYRLFSIPLFLPFVPNLGHSISYPHCRLCLTIPAFLLCQLFKHLQQWAQPCPVGAKWRLGKSRWVA